MPIRDRLRAHPLGAALLAGGAALLGILTALALVEAIWSLISAEPLVPLVGSWFRRWGERLFGLFLILGLVALIGWLAVAQWRILALLRQPRNDELPEGVTWADGWLSAGADTTLDLTEPLAKTARSVTFTAIQNGKVIVKDKAGEVDRTGERFRLPFKVDETNQLRDGYLVIQAAIITGEGTRTVTNRLAVKTQGPLVR